MITCWGYSAVPNSERWPGKKITWLIIVNDALIFCIYWELIIFTVFGREVLNKLNGCFAPLRNKMYARKMIEGYIGKMIKIENIITSVFFILIWWNSWCYGMHTKKLHCARITYRLWCLSSSCSYPHIVNNQVDLRFVLQ